MKRDKKQPPDDSSELAALIGPFWSEARTKQALGAQHMPATGHLPAGQVALGLPTADGPTIYPTWQFERTPQGVRIKTALAPLIETLAAHDPWAVAVLICTPAPELAGQSPLDAIRTNPHLDLKQLATQVDREWSKGAARG